MLKATCFLVVTLTATLTLSVANAQTTQPSSPPTGAMRSTNATLKAKAAATQSTIQAIRSQLELYRLQHKDQYPTVTALSDWGAMTHRTNEAGDIVQDANGGVQVFGPYLRSAPANPFTSLTEFASTDAIHATTGWTMKNQNGSSRFCAVVPDLPALRDLLSDQDAVFSNKVRMAAPDEAARIVSEARAAAAASMLQSVRSQNELYKLIHKNQPAKLADVAEWQVFLNVTNEDGKTPGPGERPTGPFLRNAPVNPLTGQSKVVAAGKASADAGWTYDEKRGRLYLIVPADASIPGGLTAEDVERVKP